jgi:hypothetical protein
MNWKTAEAIDIQRIWAAQDLRSVLFYLKKIVNVTITKDDLTHFRTRGALNAFLILQLGVDYLLTETRRMEAEVARDIPQTAAMYSERIAEFNHSIEAANRTIAERDAKIREFRARLERLRAANLRDREAIHKCQRKLRDAQPATDSDSDEPGAVPDAPRKRRRAQKQPMTGWEGTTDSEGTATSREGNDTYATQQVAQGNSPNGDSF